MELNLRSSAVAAAELSRVDPALYAIDRILRKSPCMPAPLPNPWQNFVTNELKRVASAAGLVPPDDHGPNVSCGGFPSAGTLAPAFHPKETFGSETRLKLCRDDQAISGGLCVVVGRCRGSYEASAAEESGAPQHRLHMQLAEPLHQQAATGDEICLELYEEVSAAGLEGAGLQSQFLTQRHTQGLDGVQ